MAGNTFGDLLKAGQLDLLKQASSDIKASEKKSAKANVAKPKEKTLSSPDTSKDILEEDYTIFHSYVMSVVQRNELYDTMFDYGDEESFSAIAELYDNPVCRDIVDYFACCFLNSKVFCSCCSSRESLRLTGATCLGFSIGAAGATFTTEGVEATGCTDFFTDTFGVFDFGAGSVVAG